MSSLTDIDKRYLEKLLGMESGYVLDYSDATFGEFFARHRVKIHSREYQKYGTSKAKKMRAFWEREDDKKVGEVVAEMLDSYEANCDLNDQETDSKILGRARQIVGRLKGVSSDTESVSSKSDFLNQEFSIPNLEKLPVDSLVVNIIESRLDEARVALGAGAYLSVIFLCGSVLEGVLLGAAQRNPSNFNRSTSSPKTRDDKVKMFHEWSLAELIDVSCDIGILKPDVKKFGHGLRDFRNYIHPYQQMLSGFQPDEHTAKVCFQVLKAALASVAGDR